LVSYSKVFDSIPINWFVPEKNYTAGDKFNIGVTYNWGGQAASRDFSVVIYSSQNLEIKDIKGQTNMLHYDGNTPSGLKSNPFYKTYEPLIKRWSATTSPKKTPSETDIFTWSYDNMKLTLSDLWIFKGLENEAELKKKYEDYYPSPDLAAAMK